MRRLLPAAAAWLALLVSQRAGAQPPVIGVTGDPPADAARARLIEELESQGYEVIEADKDEARVGLSARLTVRSRRIEVRVVNRRNGGVERREAVIELGPNDDDTTNAAIRAAEYLRASLIEVGASPPTKFPPPAQPAFPGTDQPPPPRPATRKAEASAASVHLGFGPGFLYSTGGLAPAPTLDPSIRWRVSRGGGAKLQARVPLSASPVARNEGSVSLRATGVGVSLWYAPPSGRWIEPYLDAGLHAFFLSLPAKASSGYVAEDHNRVFGAALVGGGLVLFPGRVRLTIAASTGPAFQHEHVKILGQTVARWGEWLVAGALMVEAGLD